MVNKVVNTYWEAADGEKFDSELEALEYEKQQQEKIDLAVDKYLKSFEGKKYDVNELGVWEVYGEDHKSDFDGYHYEPKLGIVSGLYGNAVKWAVQQSGWNYWGAGGSIKRLEEPVIVEV